MDLLGFKLCQPSMTILLISAAGVIYHLLVQDNEGMLWWLLVGVFGTGVFQALCFGGLEPIAWTLMLIPVLVVCFFLAVALFASKVRIHNVQKHCPTPTCTKKPTCAARCVSCTGSPAL